MMKKENFFNQHSDLVVINDSNSIIIYAHQLNQYYHTLLGNPFERLKYYNSSTKEYHFHRTPGMMNYISRYYLHHGCLTTEIHYPPEILYDELVFFGFNIQMIYQIISNLITVNYYIPSGKYRRVFWFRFDHQPSRTLWNLIRIIKGFITLCSVSTSFMFIELSNHLFDQNKFFIRKILFIEIMILIFCYIELSIEYFIRPRFQTPTFVFILIHFFSLIPIALFLFIWSNPPTWLYSFLVIQYAARIVRSVRLSTRAYQIMYVLTERLEVYLQSFQTIALIVLVLALLTLACDQISSPNQFQAFSEMIWISVNAFTSLGEGTSRPLTTPGLIIEFFTCFLGVLIIPQLAQLIYTIVSTTIDGQEINEKKQMKKHFVLLEDEHGNQAIGQVDVDQDGYWSLPEILIQKDEF